MAMLHAESRLTLELPDGRALAWSQWGPDDGRPVLFCTGAGMSGTLGFGTDVLGDLGLRLLSVDRPGLGRSSPHPAKTLGTWVMDVRHLVQRCSLEDVVAVGFSQGAVFAMALACAGVVRAVAIVSGQDDLLAVRHRLQPDVVGMLDAVTTDPAAFEHEVAAVANADWLWTLVVGTSSDRDRNIYTGEPLGPAYRRALDEGFAQGPAGYVRDLRNALGAWLVPPERIHVPVDLWYGALDTSPVHSPDHGQTLATRFHTARHYLLPDEGSSLLWTRAPEILRTLNGA